MPMEAIHKISHSSTPIGVCSEMPLQIYTLFQIGSVLPIRISDIQKYPETSQSFTLSAEKILHQTSGACFVGGRRIGIPNGVCILDVDPHEAMI